MTARPFVLSMSWIQTVLSVQGCWAVGSEALYVVIDERLPLERMEDVQFVRRNHQGIPARGMASKVIRDYLYSTEVYELN